MEYKLVFKYVQDHINFVYKETLFSELHKSYYLEERTKINTTTQKRQNSILSVFSKIH